MIDDANLNTYANYDVNRISDILFLFSFGRFPFLIKTFPGLQTTADFYLHF